MNVRGKQIHQGKIFTPQDRPLQKWLRPLVVVQRFLKSCFNGLLERVSDELLGKHESDDEGGTLIAFGVLFFLSIVVYRTQAYELLIAASAGGLWLWDYHQSRKYYLDPNHRTKILLHQDETSFFLQAGGATNPLTLVDSFQQAELHSLKIFREPVFAGIFNTLVDNTWRIYLCLEGQRLLLLDEDANAGRLVRRTSALADHLKVPLYFEDALDPKPKGPERVTVKKNGVRTLLSTAWRREDTLRLVRQAFHESGFFLYLLLVYGLLVRWGGLMNWFFGPSLGLSPGSLSLDFSLGGFVQLMMPPLDPVDWAELGLGLGLIMRTGWLRSRPVKLAISPEKLTITLAGQAAHQLKLTQARIFFFEKESLILLIDEQSSCEIGHLPDHETCEDLYRQLVPYLPKPVFEDDLIDHPTAEQPQAILADTSWPQFSLAEDPFGSSQPMKQHSNKPDLDKFLGN